MSAAPRILVVDDTPQNVKLLGDVLGIKGYEVTAAASGTEALERIAQQKPDLVLLDVVMPGMSGYDVCRRIRDTPATATLPVVMVTALDPATERIKGIEAGADDVQSDTAGHLVTCTFESLGAVSGALELKLGEAASVKALWRPMQTTAVDEERAASILKLIAGLEDDEDVQNVYSNFEVSDAVLAKLTAA